MAYNKNEYNKEYSKRTGYAAQEKYNKEQVKAFTIKFNKKEDADIIEKLETLPSKVEYFRRIIREDIERENNS